MRVLLLGAVLCGVVYAQQPFYTDDADVTDRHHFHLEVSNQQSWLQNTSLPAVRQNTTVVQINYGLTHNFELGVDAPLILLYQRNTPLVYGQGDFDMTFKLRFHEEHKGDSAPAFTLSCAIETTTGSVHKQLGSGIPDYGCNTVVQKQLGLWTLRGNNGMIFSGNTLTGVIGLRATGFVYTGSGSVTRDVLPRLTLGAEVTGSSSPDATALGKAILQSQIGGNFTIMEGFTLDFGVVTGWFSGAPRHQIQLGMSKDF